MLLLCGYGLHSTIVDVFTELDDFNLSEGQLLLLAMKQDQGWNTSEILDKAMFYDSIATRNRQIKSGEKVSQAVGDSQMAYW